MFALLKKRQIIFPLLLCFALVLLISYFTLGRSRKGSPLPKTNQARQDSPAFAASDASHSRASRHSISVDADTDGIPDAAELQSFMDRQNFRQWFTLIAEGQFYQLSDQWNVEQRDCAGLVRFAWREALRRHDRAWFQKMGAGYSAIAPDVARYSLEQGPLGEKLFRTSFGSYQEGESGSGTFSEFADARTLKSFNAKFISRDRQHIQPGDLLFFYQPWVQKYPYHVMVFLGDARLSNEQTNDWVVYHTGATPTDDGVVKKVALSVLDHHPNKRWRPVESNSNFLGFYRLKILD